MGCSYNLRLCVKNMKQNEMVAKKRSILADAIQILYLFVLISIAIYLLPSIPVIYRMAAGVIIYFVIQKWVPGYILRHYYSGVRLAKDHHYNEAVTHFKKMYDFIMKRP